MMPRFPSILTQFPKPHVIKPKDEPQIAPPPTSTIAPTMPEPLPTKPPEVAPEPTSTIAPEKPDAPIAPPPKTTIAPKRPDPLPTKPPAVVAPKPKTTWMRPPIGTATDDGLMPGDEGYVDPHAETMADWNNIDKNSTGGFRPDGTAILHSDPDSAHSLSLLSSASQREEESGNYQGTGRKHRGTGNRARLAANKTQGQSATLLTE